MYYLYFSRLLCVLCFVAATSAREKHIAAIEPISDGQIGVNLPTLPPASIFGGKIGKNTEYLTELSGGVTSWKGSDPSYITRTTITTATRSGEAKATVTSDVLLDVSTPENGDINILTSPALRKALEDIAAKVPPCAAKGLKSRDTSCGILNFFERVESSQPTIVEALNSVNDYIGANRAVISASDIAAWVSAFRVGAVANNPVLLVGSAFGILVVVWDQLESTKTIPPVLAFPSNVVGTVAATPTTSKSCPEKRLICNDPTCEGILLSKCTVGEYKGCPCKIWEGMAGYAGYEGKNDYIQQIMKLSLDPVPLPLATCDTMNRVGIETADFKSLVSTFCKDNNLSKDTLRGLSMNNADSSDNSGRTVYFVWQYGRGACDYSCVDIYTAFLKPTPCSFSSHIMSVGGNLTQKCGTATYKIVDPIISPLQSATTSPLPSPTQAYVGPPLGVPLCFTGGERFSRTDAANSISFFCNKAETQKMWLGGGGWKFDDVKTFGETSLDPGVNAVGISFNPNSVYCPPGAAKSEVSLGAMTVEKCISNFLLTVDSCAPLVAPSTGVFLKHGGIVYADCAVWQLNTVAR